MKPTPEQDQILVSLHGALRIAAGAGTGKTDTLRQAVVDLIAGDVRAGEILCLTFTVEATKEMRRRVVREFESRRDIDADEITVQTYHAFAQSIVREHVLFTGLDREPALIDQAQKWQLVLEALDRCSFDELEIGWLPGFVEKLLTLHEEIQRNDLSLEQVEAWCRAHNTDEVVRDRLEAIAALREYRNLERARNAIDFGEQITLANELLRMRADVLGRIRSRFRYVFLDEYQDTDIAQRELVKLLGTGAELVCAVGDVDQGIFGWRGATIHNMFAFPDDFPGARTLPLSLNFRSGQRILDLANALIEPFEPPAGYVREPLRAVDGAPEAVVEAFVAAHSEDEADGIARRISEAREPWSQYAVLVRKRSQMDAIFRALAAHDIPIEIDTLGGFWTRPEILDVQSWLELLADPEDNIALARLLLGPAYRLGQRDLFFLADYAKGHNREQRRRPIGDRDLLAYSLVDSIVAHKEIPNLSDQARARLAELQSVWLELTGIAERVSLGNLVGEIARVSGLSAALAASTDPEAAVALRHLAKLRDLAETYQPVAGSADLAGFVAYLDTIEDVEQDEDELRAVDPNAVRLMTTFRGKGLEWETVFLPGLSDGVMPAAPRGGNNPSKCWHRLPFDLRGDREFLPAETDEGIALLKADEERRLMYVGVTRAKRRLILSHAWFYWDNLTAKTPSPFWQEALETGLVDITEFVECPLENPRPTDAETAAQLHGRFEVVRDEAAITRIESELERLRSLEAALPPTAVERAPSTLSVTAFLTFIRDPDEFFWRYVRRTPRPPSPAAQLGIDLHHRIELHYRGAVPVGSTPQEPDEPYDLDASEYDTDEATVSADQLWEHFQRSRLANRQPLMMEQPFTLYLGHGISVAGRIDAIFEADDGTWEIVDYKTGRSDPDPLQLALYGRAVREIWGHDAACSWLLLRDGRELDAPNVDGLDKLLQQAVLRLQAVGR